jgi:GNAT superfamily N-acetyltransferase
MLGGFFHGWRRPLSPETHLRVLRGSGLVVLAVDDSASRVVGFINALTDGCQSAFIPLLEVLPEYRGKGIGRELVKRMLDQLKNFPCVDLTCDPKLQPFYEKFGMQRSVGMVIRNY